MDSAKHDLILAPLKIWEKTNNKHENDIQYPGLVLAMHSLPDDEFLDKRLNNCIVTVILKELHQE